MSTTTSTPPAKTTTRLYTDAAGKVRVKGSRFQPKRTRYKGRKSRALRAVQNVLFHIKGRDLNARERGALNSLSNALERDGSTGSGR